MLLELIRSEYKESFLTTMEPYVEKSIENFNKAYYISSEYIKNDLYPLIIGYVNIIVNNTQINNEHMCLIPELTSYDVVKYRY